MKIAEALITKANIETKISRLQSRITKNLLVQEGEDPQEDAKDLIKQLERANNELTNIIIGIQNANARNFIINEEGIEQDITIQEGLVKRDGLIKLHDKLRYFAGEAVPNTRYSNSEIKILSTIDAKKLQKQADDLALEARELDIAIQRTNWIVNI